MTTRLFGCLDIAERQIVLKHIDLCSGIGGFALGFEWAGLSSPVMFCDIEPWSRKVLAKHWPDVPIEEDVKVLANEPEKIPAGGRDTILTAGYPCQPFSNSGKRRGTEDDRAIWPYIREIVAHKRPSWCVFENVYGHVSMGLDEVLSDLEADGYATRPFIVPAASVDASHRRDSVWIVGYTENVGRHGGAEATRREGQTHQQDEPRLSVRGEPIRPSEDVANPNNSGNRAQRDDPDTEGQEVVKGWEEQSQYQFSRQRQDVAHTDSKRSKVKGQHQTDATESLFRGSDARGSRGNDRWEFGASPNEENVPDSASQRLEGRKRSEHEGHGERFAESGVRAGGFWAAEPNVGRVANGIPRRVDRIKGLGNAIVPQIAMQIGLTIKNCHEAMGG